MQLITARHEGRTRAGVVEGDEVALTDSADVGSLLREAGGDPRRISARGPRVPLAQADPAPLIPRPDKIVCLGLNYARHIAEMGREPPRYPTLFAKYAAALIGARDPIVLPRVSDQVDWEAELAVVVGRPGRHIPAGDALAHVAGYTVLNDVTARDWQYRTGEFLSGKTFEATTPLGPFLVTPDELPPGASGLAISCAVDGVEMQRSTTADLLFDVAAILAYVSQITTLRPGDVIATGTPGGVGAGRNPQLFLRAGQTVTTEIEGIGRLENVCAAEPAEPAESGR